MIVWGCVCAEGEEPTRYDARAGILMLVVRGNDVDGWWWEISVIGETDGELGHRVVIDRGQNARSYGAQSAAHGSAGQIAAAIRGSL